MADGLLLAEENSFWFREMSSHNPKIPTSSNSAPSELLEDIAFELFVTKIVPNFISLFNPILQMVIMATWEMVQNWLTTL